MSGNAIQAVRQFAKPGAGTQVSAAKEIAIGLTLGLAAGCTFKSWHLNEKRKISEYYETLEQLNKEKADGAVIEE